MRTIFFFLCTMMLHLTAQAQPNDLVYQLLKNAKLHSLDTVLQNADKYEVQIVYTQINRDKKNRPTFNTFTYRHLPNQYFYPASTVKLPTAVFALCFLNQEKIQAQQMLKIKELHTQNYEVENDSSAQNYEASIAHYVHKNFVVSDNDAYCRLFELTGQAYLQQNLAKYGYKNTKILRRFKVVAPNGNQFANAFDFFDAKGNITHKIPERFNDFLYKNTLEGCKKGVGYYKDDSLVHEPMDFLQSNCFPVMEQHRFLKELMFVKEQKMPLPLTANDYKLLYKSMHLLPRQSSIKSYADTTEYYDGYCKFFMYGNSKNAVMPDNILIFNKVGEAYGTLTDNAYVVDTLHGVEFLLTATIYVNDDQIFNDDNYEYDSIGYPFLEDVGSVIYAHELARVKKNKPNFDGLLEFLK